MNAFLVKTQKKHILLGMLILASLLITSCKPTPTTTSDPTKPAPTGTPEAISIASTETPTNTPTLTPTETSTPTATPTATPTNPSTSIPDETSFLPDYQDIPYVPDGSTAQSLDIYLPPGLDGPYPTVFMIHGYEQDKRADTMSTVAQFAIDQGYAAVSIGWRFGEDSGQPFSFQDAFCALAWVHANAEAYGFDTGRIIVFGHSTGALFAELIGLVDEETIFLENCPHQLPARDRVRGVVTFSSGGWIPGSPWFENPLSMSMLARVTGKSPEEVDAITKKLFGIVSGEWDSSDQLNDAERAFAQYLPPYWANSGAAPFLLMLGNDDTQVSMIDAELFTSLLFSARIQAQFVRIADTGAQLGSDSWQEPLGQFLGDQFDRWDYVALGDSIPNGFGVTDNRSYVNIYADYTREDLDVAVILHKWTQDGETTGQLLERLRNDQELRDDISTAEVITIWTGWNDLGGALSLYYNSTCGGDDNLDCFRQSVGMLKTNIDAIIAEILSLRNPWDAQIIIADGGNPFVDAWKEQGIFETLREPAFEVWRDHIHLAAEENDLLVVYSYEVLNGPQGDMDPDALGIMQADGLHFNMDGHTLLADLHRELGY
ncbi:MAG: GDSL-type esterase/lipase family protein [Anaerolineaceae bacterium]|nr:GDSL-type esterase/lipase family protein [Anaerolineaceae bacterium]